MKRITARKRRERRAAQPVVDAVMERDGGCILRPLAGRRVPPCFPPGSMTPHHLRKQSKQGEWSLENCVCLCASHNDWVECWPKTAHDLGLVVRNGETVDDAWERMRSAGLAVGSTS